MPSFILHYFDFRIDHNGFLASYHHHLRICPRIYVRSSHPRHVLCACRRLFPTICSSLEDMRNVLTGAHGRRLCYSARRWPVGCEEILEVEADDE